ESRVPEDLLRGVGLREGRQRLIEIVVGGARRSILAQPRVPLPNGINRGWSVGLAATRDRGAGRIAGALLHADTPLIDRTAVGQALGAGARHRQPGIGHAPAKIRRALAVVHVAVDAN